jgi:hypothetical protein
MAAGQPIRRRDAVALARAVLESEVVRAAEAVLEAPDDARLARLVELLTLAPELAPQAATTRLRGRA